jgi:hypothetical protein
MKEETLALILAVVASCGAGYMYGHFSAENKIYHNCERIQQFKVDVGGMDFLYSCKRQRP